MPTFKEIAIRQFERDRADLQRQLDEMLSGQMRTGAKRGANSPMVDTTEEEIEDTRRKIAEIDAILARRGDPQ